MESSDQNYLQDIDSFYHPHSGGMTNYVPGTKLLRFLSGQAQKSRDINHHVIPAGHHLGQDPIPFRQEKVLKVFRRQSTGIVERFLRV